jgi:hypothetical protein
LHPKPVGGLLAGTRLAERTLAADDEAEFPVKGLERPH